MWGQCKPFLQEGRILGMGFWPELTFWNAPRLSVETLALYREGRPWNPSP